MQQMRPFSITAPGFAGLNTQDAPVDMDGRFALIADNCVIDKYGRVGSRKGWEPRNTTNVDLGTANIAAMGELIQGDGTRTILAAGNNKLFKQTGTTLTTLTYGGGGSAPTITASNWQICVLNGVALFFQVGHDPLIYDPVFSVTQYRRISETALYSGTVPLANCAISAYGRIWAASTATDRNTVTWSDTLTYQKWTGGTAGTLNLHGVWPQGGDEIIALAAHNDRLIIFGRKQVLIYEGADNPSTMSLSDSIASTGCVGRDTVQNTGSDLVFLSDTGLRALGRTIQEKSAPIGQLSSNIDSDIKSYIVAEVTGSTIKSGYSQLDSIYLLTFVNSQVTYCFDTRTLLENGAARVTTWSLIPKSMFYSPLTGLMFGFSGFIGNYSTYLDNGAAYRMSYFSSWLDFGDPVRTSILKKIIMTMFGAVNQGVVYKWGFDYISGTDSLTDTLTGTVPVSEYGIDEYGIAEYVQNVVIKTVGMNTRGSGKVIQVGLEVQIIGNPISVQRIDIYTKDGRY